MSGERSPEQADRCSVHETFTPGCDACLTVYLAPPVVAADAPSEKVVGLMGALADAVDKAKADRAAAVPDEPADAERDMAEVMYLRWVQMGSDPSLPLCDARERTRRLAAFLARRGYQRVPEGSAVVDVEQLAEALVKKVREVERRVPGAFDFADVRSVLRPLSAGDGDRSET